MQKSVKLSGAGMPRQSKTLHSRILKMKKILLPLIILLSFSFGLTGCFDSSSAGDDFIGEWSNTQKYHSVVITKNSAGFNIDYTHLRLGHETRDTFLAIFNNGRLEVTPGGALVMANDGQLLQVSNLVNTYIEFNRTTK